jgi:hypothetical protein
MDVLWLGGGCGAGKSTLARRLAYRFDLRLYPVDAHAFDHDARARPEAHPVMTRQAKLDFTARHVTPTVRERVDVFVDYARERFDLILEDLRLLGPGPLVLAEGPWLLPSLVASTGTHPQWTVWLLPTPAFTARSLGIRNEPRPTRDESARDRADRLRLARDEQLILLMRRDANQLGLPVYEVDGSRSIEQTEQDLTEHFAAALDRGPRIRDGAERVAIRRAENAVVLAQLNAFRAYLGESAPPEPPFPFVCECTTLGCGAPVPLTRAEYRRAGGALAH